MVCTDVVEPYQTLSFLRTNEARVLYLRGKRRGALKRGDVATSTESMRMAKTWWLRLFYVAFYAFVEGLLWVFTG